MRQVLQQGLCLLQAEIAYLLCSSHFGKTTGQIISVDGGLEEAFLR